VYICLHLLTLRVVKYKPHAGKKVLVSTKTNAEHNYHNLQHFFLFYLLSKFQVTKVIFPVFASSYEFGKFILLHNFLKYILTSSFVFLVFRFHVSKAHSIFHYICQLSCVFVVALKGIGICFQAEERKLSKI